MEEFFMLNSCRLNIHQMTLQIRRDQESNCFYQLSYKCSKETILYILLGNEKCFSILFYFQLVGFNFLGKIQWKIILLLSWHQLNSQFLPRRVLDMFYPIFCFQQTFWLNIRHSMSPLNNIYIFRRIFLHQKLKNRAKIEKSVKIKN